MSKYGPGGILNAAKDKKSDRSPDYWGQVKLDATIVAYLIAEMDAGTHEPVIRLSGWKKVSSKDGSTFLSLSVSIPKEANVIPKSAPSAPSVPVDDIGDEIPF